MLTAFSLPMGKKVRSTSGWTFLMYSLNARESIARSWLSTKSRIVLTVESPFTEVIMYFNLVDNSGDESFFIFLRPSNSASIFFSSEWVKILKVTTAFVLGNVNENSFTFGVIKDTSNGLLSIILKSTVSSCPL